MAIPTAEVNSLTYKLPAELGADLDAAIAEWSKGDKVRRLWARDAALWTGGDEGNWLGWLGITEDQLAKSQRFSDVASSIQAAGFKHAVLLGMGGSSLCPEVLAMTFGKAAGFPALLVLDSTDPAQVQAIESRIDVAQTVFIVASKSGSTLEANIFKQYFFERVKQAIGAEQAATRFIAITDPGSKFEQIAAAERFRHIFHGVSSIGGRYSALSDFGMVPAAIMGIDAPRFLARAHVMAGACSPGVPVGKNPGVLLGLVLGVAARHGWDKLTLITSPGIWDLGAWLEQLIAESTGKDGMGIIPVDREPPAAPGSYGNDRLFAYLRLESGADPAQDKAVQALVDAGNPVIRIAIAGIYELGQEFFRWEIATAVAGALLGINPFNQPDVEASKIATRRLTDEYEQTGLLPAELPVFSGDGIELYTNARNATALAAALAGDRSLAGYLRAHFKRLLGGDYFALLAYVEMNERHFAVLQDIRQAILNRRHVATCLGFGPRFLHSTGQAYKGGPASGVFLQITCDDQADLAVPGQKYTFGTVKAAQARGDFEVLAERGRRALRVHLRDVATGLPALHSAVAKALA